MSPRASASSKAADTLAAASFTAAMKGVSTVSMFSSAVTPISRSLMPTRLFTRSRAWARLSLDSFTPAARSPISCSSSPQLAPISAEAASILSVSPFSSRMARPTVSITVPMAVVPSLTARALAALAALSAIRRWACSLRYFSVASISVVASLVLVDSDLTSLATTANPRPASPARAASIVAFSASRLVCLAMVKISLATLPTRSSASRSPAICPSIPVTEDTSAWMSDSDRCTRSCELSTSCRACSVTDRATAEASEMRCVLRDILAPVSRSCVKTSDWWVTRAFTSSMWPAMSAISMPRLPASVAMSAIRCGRSVKLPSIMPTILAVL